MQQKLPKQGWHKIVITRYYLWSLLWCGAIVISFLFFSFYQWIISHPGKTGTPKLDLSEDQKACVSAENLTSHQLLIERIIINKTEDQKSKSSASKMERWWQCLEVYSYWSWNKWSNSWQEMLPKRFWGGDIKATIRKETPRIWDYSMSAKLRY